MSNDGHIRVATVDDAESVQQIYAPFCASSAVTFEETPPSVPEMKTRIESTLETYPWLVYVKQGSDDSNEVVGYAYADTLRKRAAYQWVVELSVYIKKGHRNSGVGAQLYDSLLSILERQGVRDAYAVTTLPNEATVTFHERLGFERVVEFPKMGYTEGNWHDVAWWRYKLVEKGLDPEPLIPFSELRDEKDIIS